MATAASRAGERVEGQLETRTTTDRVLLRAFLERDRLYAAYAICDLDAREFARTRWGAAFDGDRLLAVALEYVGFAPQPLFLMGDPDGVAAVLHDVIRPRAAYVAGLPAHLAAVERIYRVAPGATARLLPSEIGDLNRLYNLGFTSWLPAEAVAQGVYYGIRVGGRLVAAAGTHVISEEA